MCEKVKHQTKGNAIIAWKRTGGNVQMNTYFCKKCKAWHLGHSGAPHRRTARINQLLDKVLGKNAQPKHAH